MATAGESRSDDETEPPAFDALLGDDAEVATLRALALALALAAEGRCDELRELYRVALAAGVEPQALTEGALAAHLFGGFPRAIESFLALADAGGVAPYGAAHDPRTTTSQRLEGAELFERIYGKATAAVRTQLATFGVDFEFAVLQDAYGRILSRPQLDPRTRELMAICALAALRLDRQLFSHLRGAVALGATHDDARSMIDLAIAIAPDRGKRAKAVFHEAFGLEF